MPDFKFSCPQCGQHILCDIDCAGTQINCPNCNQAVIIPQAPRPAAPPPSPRIAVAYDAPRPPRPAEAKSHALRNTLVVIVTLVVLAGFGVGGWFGYSKYEAKQALKFGNPAAQVATPTADQAVQALSILSKVHSAYTNVSTVKAEGTFTVFLVLSNLTMADVNPGMPAKAPNAKRHPQGMPRTVTNTTAISIKQGTSNFYYFAGEAVSKIDRLKITNTFAFWSSDRGRFLFNDIHQPRVPVTYMQLPDVNPMDNSMQQFKQIQHLFQDPANLTKIIKDLGQTEDDAVNGQDCYTLTAKVLGQKVKIWVDKSSYLVPQWQVTLGGAVNDADIDDAFSLVAASYTNLPPMELDMVKSQVERMTPAMTKIRGTIFSTTESIEVNPALVAADFNYTVPPGVKLTKLPNPAMTGRPPN